ncbi:Nucleolar protein 9 [Apiospora phragmitis]|uniref:Nucleolar protein 9 n=1 Tax=Apiospora phragmitis TaxID=2905665 RepID=A0ABR1TW44_9PEZI
MPKARSKRQSIREERKAKRQEKHADDADAEERQAAKRQRIDEEGNAAFQGSEENGAEPAFEQGHEQPEKEFFGMLTDEEQEYFRSVDEVLDVDEFPSQEDRDIYLSNVFIEAQGKELKLACSQSCSRLLERLIIMSNTRQKKKLFEQFATHFPQPPAAQIRKPLLRDAFRAIRAYTIAFDGGAVPSQLDELEGHFSYLLTDRFASHSIRVLLMILSGRPLEESSTKSLMHSRRKEKISVPWTSNNTSDNSASAQARAVPSVFTLAAKKIIGDSTAGMDATALHVLATHPTVPANDFVNAMLYDPVGSRLLETLVTHCPGKVFKAMWRTNLGPRIHSLVRNDIASYPAIRMLNRVGKEELVAAMEKIFPEVPKLVSLSRFNVIKTLFERCQVREAKPEIDSLMRVLTAALGRDKKELVPKLCIPKAADESETKKGQPSISKAQSVIASHGCHLTTTLLSIPGLPAKSIQTSLHSLPPEVLLCLATSSGPTAHVLLAAFTSPSQDKVFHKALVAALIPHTMELAQSQYGSIVLSSIIYMPTRSEGIMLPFHLKEQIMTRLSQHEPELRETFEGRKSGEAVELPWQKKKAAASAAAPKPKHGGKGDAGDNPNMVDVDGGARKRKRGADVEDTEMS